MRLDLYGRYRVNQLIVHGVILSLDMFYWIEETLFASLNRISSVRYTFTSEL